MLFLAVAMPVVACQQLKLDSPRHGHAMQQTACCLDSCEAHEPREDSLLTLVYCSLHLLSRVVLCRMAWECCLLLAGLLSSTCRTRRE